MNPNNRGRLRHLTTPLQALVLGLLVALGACESASVEMNSRHCSPPCSLGYACVDGDCVADDGTCNPPCGARSVCQQGRCLIASSDVGPKPRPGHQLDGESWTLLIYLVADNNLEGAAIGDLHEMMAVGSTDDAHLIVQIDRSERHHEGGVGGLPDFTGAKRLRVEAGSLTELADLGEIAMGTPEALADFIAWGVQAYPADRYGLVLWDHGGGWIIFGTDDAPYHHGLDLRELSEGVRVGLERAGLSRLALIGIDACLMGTWEVAHALHPYAEYLLASQELEPGHGWDYRSLAVVRDDPKADPVALGEELIRGFHAQAKGFKTLHEITLSLVDLTRWGALEAGLAELLAALDGQVPALASTIGRERAAALGFGRSADPTQDYYLVDLGDFLGRLEGHLGPLASATTQLREALADAVVSRASGPATTRATGLAIYFPPNDARYRRSYDNLTGLEPWRGFLKQLFVAGALGAGGPLFAASAHAADAHWQGGRVTVSADVAVASQAQVTSVGAWLGVVEQTTGRVVAVAAREPTQSNGQVAIAWTPELLVLSQGTRQAWAYVSERLDAASGLRTLVIPLSYQPAKGAASHAELRRVVDAAGAVQSQLLFQVAGDATAELAPEPGAVLRPMTRILDKGALTWEPSSDVAFDATQPLTVTTTAMPPGTRLYLELDIYDGAGRSDFAFATVTTPAATVPAGAACGDVDLTGRCDGGRLSYCDGGLLVVYDCALDGCGCGFEPVRGYYDCLCAP